VIIKNRNLQARDCEFHAKQAVNRGMASGGSQKIRRSLTVSYCLGEASGATVDAGNRASFGDRKTRERGGL
jgi:hypothetical protein